MLQPTLPFFTKERLCFPFFALSIFPCLRWVERISKSKSISQSQWIEFIQLIPAFNFCDWIFMMLTTELTSLCKCIGWQWTWDAEYWAPNNSTNDSVKEGQKHVFLFDTLRYSCSTLTNCEGECSVYSILTCKKLNYRVNQLNQRLNSQNANIVSIVYRSYTL